ncbi:hypothetical protein LZ32DRAFT_221147 [Colletotrichum eremochloae]|nr:hypothetical protein LZ32DRAFT_221147 [Colletotrichum eremochloae]
MSFPILLGPRMHCPCLPPPLSSPWPMRTRRGYGTSRRVRIRKKKKKKREDKQSDCCVWLRLAVGTFNNEAECNPPNLPLPFASGGLSLGSNYLSYPVSRAPLFIYNLEHPRLNNGRTRRQVEPNFFFFFFFVLSFCHYAKAQCASNASNAGFAS